MCSGAHSRAHVRVHTQLKNLVRALTARSAGSSRNISTGHANNREMRRHHAISPGFNRDLGILSLKLHDSACSCIVFYPGNLVLNTGSVFLQLCIRSVHPRSRRCRLNQCIPGRIALNAGQVANARAPVVSLYSSLTG